MPLRPDVRLALAALAAELGVDVDELPGSIQGILTAFRAASYGDGCREALRMMGVKNNKAEGTPTVRNPSGTYRQQD